MITVSAIICPQCGDKIFSRANHDFHWCFCKSTAVDGGFSYLRIAFKNIVPKQIKLKIKATKNELYSDWNTGKDKFGLIKPKNHTKNE